jgi:hypothetical protein
VLVVAEGTFGERPTSYYDLYRINGGKSAEHWDTLETSPSRSEWKNTNGKSELLTISSSSDGQIKVLAQNT